MQIGFGKTAKDARANVARQTRSCQSVVGKETVDYINIPSRIRGRPPYVMGRIGRQTRDGAAQLCRSLARDGCICRIYRNPT